jgi:hypothetical protein
MRKNLKYYPLSNYISTPIYFVHLGKYHVLTNISSNRGVKHPICHPLELQPQINIMFALEIVITTYIVSQQGPQQK